MIKISVPNDDHVALRAMAKALEEIAVARGASLQVNLVTEEMLEKLKETRGGNIVCEPEVDTTSQQVESLGTPVVDLTVDLPEPIVSDATTDSTGTPWDERIHSASKALNADGTWRLRRKPKDMDEYVWAEFITDVLFDIKNNVESEEEGLSIEEWVKEQEQNGYEEKEPIVTPEGDDFHVDAGVVTEQQVASFPPPPPVPQVKLTDADTSKVHDVLSWPAPEYVHMTFPQVMAFLTERHGRITSAQVDQIIADMGLEKITDLNTQPEHTGPFIARVKALLGE